MRPDIKQRQTKTELVATTENPASLSILDRIRAFIHAVNASYSQWYRRKRRALYLSVLVLELAYIFTTVPLRIAFFFDPYAHTSSKSAGWTTALTAYTTVDVLLDITSVASLYEIFNAKRRALAAIAVDAGSAHVNPRNRRHQRGARGTIAADAAGDTTTTTQPRQKPQPRKSKGSLVVAWSLNTIVPTIKQKFDTRRPLFFEAIAMIPIELLALALGPNYLHLLRVLKVFRLHRVSDCVMEVKKLHARQPMVQLLEFTGNALLLKRVVYGLALCHWIACAYMALAHWECGLDFELCTRGVDIDSHVVDDPLKYTCWAIEDQLVGASPLRKYARAVYWSARSIITLGYYDVAPVTDVETVFGIAVQIVGAVFSTSLIATFLFVFRYLNARKQAFMAHVDEAKEYMKMSRLPADVRDGVLGFYKSYWQAHNGLSQDEITARLPEHLRVSVHKVLVAQRIQTVAFLAKESDEFINTLALKVELCLYSPKDWIIEKIPDGMYFVLRGNVMLETQGQTQPRHARPGEHFAEFALLYPGKTDERARAQTYSELYKLAHAWFVETLEIFHGKHLAQEHMERMRSMLNRRDQQQQKMKRLFGRSAGNFHRATTTTAGPRRMIDWVLPGSAFRRSWEMARFVFLVFVAYEVPYFIVFDTAAFPFTATPKVNVQSATSMVVELFFTADFALRARFFAFIDATAMIPVTDASYILAAYKKSGLWLDLVAILPVATVLELVYGAQWQAVVVLSRLLRVLRLRHLMASIHEVAQQRQLSSKAQLAITLVIVVTLTIHLTGCLWFLMARLSMHEASFNATAAATVTRDVCLRWATVEGNCSWAMLDAYGQIGAGFPASQPHSSYTGKFAYLRSIYWAIVALTTIGYGDIVAFSTLESFFAALWAFVGGVLNYAVVAAMSNIISNLTAASHHHMDTMHEMNAVLAHYGVSESVRHQVRRYYHQQFHMQKVASEASLLARLPQQLRHRISVLLHADSVKKLDVFVDHGHERLLHDLTGLFRRGVFQRGDALTQDASICDEILVIVSGHGNTYSRRVAAGVPVGTFCAGSCLGVAEMLLRTKSATCSLASSVVEVSAITYAAFTATIERRYPSEVAALTESALVLFEAEAKALDAIVGNMYSHEKLYKYTEKCTSMFTEIQELSLAQQYAKARRRLYWDAAITALNVYNAFQITFRIPFLRHISASARGLLNATDVAGDLLLALDVVLKLYYFECDDGLRNLVHRREKNANYARHYLTQDLWSLLPLYYLGSNFFYTSVLRLPRLLRLRQVPGALDSLITRVQQHSKASYLSPLKLLLILLFAAHFGACVFYWISTMDHNHHSWIHHDHVVHEAHGSVAVLYLRAYYWALTTLTLVGSREVVPLDVPGTLFASLTCLCCTFVVGHIIGELSDMILDMDKAKKELQERESSFEQFAKDHNLPTTVRTRVNHYLQFQHHHGKGMDLYETFHDLSKNLKLQLMMDLHGRLLRGLCIAPFLSDGQLQGLALRLQSELYIPGDNVVVEGDPGHRLYVLKSGGAMVMWKSTGTAVATLSEGSIFGEVAFFLKGSKRIASVQTTASVELLVLDRHGWNSLMQESDEQERDATEATLVHWVKQCLKGYNVMTVEIVKDIKSVSTLTMRSPAQAATAAPGVLEERAFRLLLRQSSNKEAQVAKSIVGARALAQQSSNRKPLSGMFSHKSARRIYAVADSAPFKPPPLLAKRPSLRHRLRPFPLLKTQSMKNGTMQQLYPAASDLMALYNPRQLRDMEDECWRRYKVSILMSDTIVGHSGTARKQGASRTDSRVASSSLAIAKAHAMDKTRKISLLVSGRRSSSKPAIPPPPAATSKHTRSSLNSSREEGVTTDGKRFLANYQTMHESLAAGWEQQQAKATTVRVTREAEDSSVGRVVQRRRFLKRTQSLPIFDRHYADIVTHELAASNVKDYASKLHLGFEVLRRVRQPESSYLFRAYKWWQRVKTSWYSSKIAKVVSAKKRTSLTHMHRLSVLNFPGRRDSTGRGGSVAIGGGGGPRFGAIHRVDDGEVFFNLLSRSYRVWECFVVLIAVFYALSLPYLVCFASRTKTLTTTAGLARWTAFVCLVDVFCLIDLVLKYTTFQAVMEMNSELHSTAPSNGAIDVVQPHHRRFSLVFMVDVLAALPFDWLLFLPSFHTLAEAQWFYLALFQFNKIFRIYQAKEASERLAQFLSFDLNLPVRDSTLRFMRSMGAYLLAGHWIACFWYRASLVAYESSPKSWLSTSKMLALDVFTSLDEVPAFRRYLRAAHFAAGSITTVFYGDIASSNVLETVAEIAVILLSIFVFGMVVGAHSERLEAKYKHRMQFEQNLSEVYLYLKTNEVPRTVRHRIKTYYMNTWLRFHGHDDFEGVQGLSTLLVEDIAQYTLRSFASKVSILKSCDECFLRALLTCLKHVICTNNEPVVRKGDVDRSMYFIARGKIIVEGKGFQLVKEEGDFFGELSLLYGIPRSATCSSLGTSLLYVLEWGAYEELLDDYPEYRHVNRREWVLVSTVLRSGESRFRSIIELVSKMETLTWVQLDSIIKKAKSLK